MTEEAKDKARDARLRRVYGISLVQYDEMLLQQGGGCAICDKTPEEEGKSLAVDHNHKTGEIRGILCAYCNHRRIGRHTDWEVVSKMAEYLKHGKGLFVPPKPKRRKKRKARKNAT